MSARTRKASSVILIFLVIAAAIIVANAHLGESASDSLPRLVLPENTLVLKALGTNTTAEGKFAIRNRSASALSYLATPSCGCSKLSPSRGILKPFGEMEITVGVNMGSYYENRRVSISFDTNDPFGSRQSFNVDVLNPAPAEVDPSEVNFGTTMIGMKKARRFTMTLNGQAGKSQSGFRQDRVVPNLKWENQIFDCSLEPSKLRDNAFVITVNVADNGTLGKHGDMLNINNVDGKLLAAVPLSIEFCQAVVAVPGSLTIRLDASNQFQAVHMIIIKRLDGKPLGKMAKVECSSFLTVRDISPNTIDNATMRAIRVMASKPSTREAQSTLTLRFDGLQDAASVKIKVLTQDE